MTVPTTTVASSEANCLMTLPTSWNSPIDRSIPAVTLTRDALGARQIDVLEQRAGDRRFGCLASTILARRGSRAHHGHAGFGHDGAHIGKVDVDEARPA